MELLENLGLALALGLLIGVERGWHERAGAEGSRIAGIRTFALIGVLGALSALLAREFGWLLLGLAFLPFAALLIVAHAMTARAYQDYGITTVIAAFITFFLGALAMLGFGTVAAVAAVVTTLMLGLKPVLHRFVARLEQRDLYAALKLLVISVVLLPVLPDRGFGPGQALNPYVIWWMVVLIAGISFVGYLAIRLAGARRGVLLTGLFGGLTSSTAVTLAFARLGRDNRSLQPLLAAGVVVAALPMFPRLLLVAGVIQPALILPLLAPLGLMAAVNALAAMWLWRRPKTGAKPAPVRFTNPLELGTAIQFGVFLAFVMLAAHLVQSRLGDTGVYLLAGVSGLGDTDAITLSLARLAQETLALHVAAGAITLAAMVNTAVKGALVVAIGGRAMALRVGTAFGLVILSGLLGLALV